ncbi:hypothetical protein [Kamptonema formosum]|nr:hypothetical protein [Oscillatoria sp. PCC 10802]
MQTLSLVRAGHWGCPLSQVNGVKIAKNLSPIVPQTLPVKLF